MRQRIDFRLTVACCLLLACALSGLAYAAPAATEAPASATATTSTKQAPTSIAKGQPPGIKVGDYAPDFELEPTAIHADFKRWLGQDAPKTFADKVMLSDLAGTAPIVLLFGSYT
ncbi:hypothetical protein ACFL34_02565 [Candidatus Sumerlaeota bacterium]